MTKIRSTLILVTLLFLVACQRDMGQLTELSVDKIELHLGDFIGAVDSFTITSNNDWNITVDSATDWLELNEDTGTGSKTIVVRASKEYTASATEATLTIRSVDPTSPPVTVRVTREVLPTTSFSLVYELNNYVLFDDVVATGDGGMITVGCTAKGELGNLWFDGLITRFSATGELVWKKQMGGGLGEHFVKIIATTDGNYLAFGQTRSKDGDISGNHGGEDIWVVKFDGYGNTIWSKCFGGKADDHAFAIGALPNGGFLMLNNTESNDGDVPMSSGSKYIKTWISTVDADGNLQKGYIIEETDRNVFFRNLAATNDGNFIVGGFRSAWYGVESEACLVKLSQAGDVLWEKRFDVGELVPSNAPVVPTDDGGYLMSYAIVADETRGDDARFIKTDAAGNKIWEKTYGGSKNEITHSLLVQPGGKGYFAAIQTNSDKDGVPGFHGDNDCWLANLDSAGNIRWSKALGGTKFDRASTIIRTSDNKYVLAGGTASPDGNIGVVNSIFAGWILKFE